MGAVEAAPAGATPVAAGDVATADPDAEGDDDGECAPAWWVLGLAEAPGRAPCDARAHSWASARPAAVLTRCAASPSAATSRGVPARAGAGAPAGSVAGAAPAAVAASTTRAERACARLGSTAGRHSLGRSTRSRPRSVRALEAMSAALVSGGGGVPPGGAVGDSWGRDGGMAIVGLPPIAPASCDLRCQRRVRHATMPRVSPQSASGCHPGRRPRAGEVAPRRLPCKTRSSTRSAADATSSSRGSPAEICRTGARRRSSLRASTRGKADSCSAQRESSGTSIVIMCRACKCTRFSGCSARTAAASRRHTRARVLAPECASAGAASASSAVATRRACGSVASLKRAPAASDANSATGCTPAVTCQPRMRARPRWTASKAARGWSSAGLASVAHTRRREAALKNSGSGVREYVRAAAREPSGSLRQAEGGASQRDMAMQRAEGQGAGATLHLAVTALHLGRPRRHRARALAAAEPGHAASTTCTPSGLPPRAAHRGWWGQPWCCMSRRGSVCECEWRADKRMGTIGWLT